MCPSCMQQRRRGGGGGYVAAQMGVPTLVGLLPLLCLQEKSKKKKHKKDKHSKKRSRHD